MYAKIFASMYDGTLAGDWKALVTFQQLVILCNQDGVVDMTAQAIAARTSIPLEIIKEGIAALEAPDKFSRTPDQEGRRIERLDAHRPWGWSIVNYRKYRQLVTAEEKRSADRERIAAKRAIEKAADTSRVVADCRDLSRASQGVANVAQAEGEGEGEAEGEKHMSGPSDADTARRLLAYLNEKAGRQFRETGPNLKLLRARLRTTTEEQIRGVIDAKCAEWLSDSKMMQYLRPATLFGESKFEQYLGQLAKPKSDDWLGKVI